MSDVLMPMVAPTRETYCTIDGTPYRGGDGTLVHAQAGHVAELKARGFRLVPSTWAVTPPTELVPDTDAQKGTADEAPTTTKPKPRTRKPQA